MAQSVWGGSQPPDNSGNWIDTGWGFWTPKESGITGSKIPDGYYDDGWGVIIPVTPAKNLDAVTVENVNAVIQNAKQFDDTKVGRIFSQVLQKGTSLLTLLQGFGVIKNPTLPITPANIDKTKAAQLYDSGALNQYEDLQLKVPQTGGNSTYFGIDFAKPLNIILVVLALWAVYQIIQQVSTPKPATVQPVQQLSSGYGRGRQRLRLAA